MSQSNTIEEAALQRNTFLENKAYVLEDNELDSSVNKALNDQYGDVIKSFADLKKKNQKRNI